MSGFDGEYTDLDRKIDNALFYAFLLAVCALGLVMVASLIAWVVA